MAVEHGRCDRDITGGEFQCRILCPAGEFEEFLPCRLRGLAVSLAEKDITTVAQGDADIDRPRSLPGAAQNLLCDGDASRTIFKRRKPGYGPTRRHEEGRVVVPL